MREACDFKGISCKAVCTRDCKRWLNFDREDVIGWCASKLDTRNIAPIDVCNAFDLKQNSAKLVTRRRKQFRQSPQCNFRVPGHIDCREATVFAQPSLTNIGHAANACCCQALNMDAEVRCMSDLDVVDRQSRSSALARDKRQPLVPVGCDQGLFQTVSLAVYAGYDHATSPCRRCAKRPGPSN